MKHTLAPWVLVYGVNTFSAASAREQVGTPPLRFPYRNRSFSGPDARANGRTFVPSSGQPLRLLAVVVSWLTFSSFVTKPRNRRMHALRSLHYFPTLEVARVTE